MFDGSTGQLEGEGAHKKRKKKKKAVWFIISLNVNGVKWYMVLIMEVLQELVA